MDGEEMADSGGCVGVGSDSGCGGDMGESTAPCSADGMDSKQTNSFLQAAIINKLTSAPSFGCHTGESTLSVVSRRLFHAINKAFSMQSTKLDPGSDPALDVMLSGVSTHSPVSTSHALSSSVTLPASILTMAPAVSTAVATGPARVVKSESNLVAVTAGLPDAIKDNFVVNVQSMCDLTDFNRQDQAAASALAGTQLLNQQLQHQLLNQSQQAQLQLLAQSQQGQSTQLSAQQQTFLGQQQQNAAAAQLLLAGGQGGLLSQAGLLNQAGLLGQNNLLANQVAGLFGQGGLLSNNLANQNSSAMSIQHLLIPVSTANGGQQLVSIPLSLAAGLGNQIQLLATSGGQLIATSMAGGSTTGTVGGAGNQLNLSLANAVPQTNANAVAAAAAAQTLALRQISQQQQLVQAQLTQQITQQQQQQQLAQQITAHLAQQQQLSLSTSTSAAAAAAAPTVAASSSVGNHPQIITNSQGQFFVIASPQLLQQALSATSQTMSVSTTSTRPTTVALPSLSLNSLPISHIQNALSSQHQRLPNLSISSPIVMRPGNGVINLASPSLGSPGLSLGGGASNEHSGGDAPSLNSNNGLTPNINQLLPSSVNSPREGTIVDGVNLDEMREFAKQFKIRRLSLGLTQTQVGQALSVTEGPSYSQSAICRFEKLDITPKSAQKIKPVLERWMGLAEERYKNGMQNLSEFIGIEPSKKRKRRTSFTPQALELLNEHFIHSTHPSGSEMTELADKLNFDREVIRVWFCNKRQTLKNTIKQLKGPSPPPPL